MKRAIVAMGGGPTRVINRSLFGIVDEASKHGIGVLGAFHGIQGVLKEEFRPLSTTRPPVSTHRSLPGAAIFSTRYKPTAEDCAKAFEIFKKREASYFFYIGGNDTAEATAIVSRAAQSAAHELRCFHVPKTIDNDLVENDHSPGYGSAARFVAHALLGDDLDVLSLPGIKIDIVMGRKAGWLAAAAALCKRSEEDGPHLIYFPERPRSLAQIVAGGARGLPEARPRGGRRLGRAARAGRRGIHLLEIHPRRTFPGALHADPGDAQRPRPDRGSRRRREEGLLRPRPALRHRNDGGRPRRGGQDRRVQGVRQGGALPRGHVRLPPALPRERALVGGRERSGDGRPQGRPLRRQEERERLRGAPRRAVRRRTIARGRN